MNEFEQKPLKSFSEVHNKAIGKGKFIIQTLAGTNDGEYKDCFQYSVRLNVYDECMVTKDGKHPLIKQAEIARFLDKQKAIDLYNYLNNL